LFSPKPEPKPDKPADVASTPTWVSRAGYKLDAALKEFQIDTHEKIAADLGSNAGGFVQVLLERGAKKVYAIEKGYGVVDWKLRKDPRVVVMERTDARKVSLPEKVDLVTTDLGWTRLIEILPKIQEVLKSNGRAVLLLKPHYEAMPEEIVGGRVKLEAIDNIIDRAKEQVAATGFSLLAQMKSPLVGAKGENPEWLLLVKPNT
jgi:23S rRNA (cytidine1920-2'-O)/16S rRNA (cytidine1409-2'-O)-methyltransferase